VYLLDEVDDVVTSGHDHVEFPIPVAAGTFRMHLRPAANDVHGVQDVMAEHPVQEREFRLFGLDPLPFDEQGFPSTSASFVVDTEEESSSSPDSH